MRIKRKSESPPTPSSTKRDTKVKDPILDPYRELGFVDEAKTGKQVHGDCPLCGASNKFYVNTTNGLFSCKVCGEEGNQVSFFSKYLSHMRTEYRMKGSRLRELSEHRSLPEWVLEDSDIAYNGEQYLLPVYNQQGSVINIRRFRLGRKIKLFNLSGLDTSIWNLNKVVKKTRRVVICEGEWDAMACRAMLAESDEQEALESGEIEVIALPGAQSWKREWNRFVDGKDVLLIFDQDDAGRKGLKKTWKLLDGASTSPRKQEYVNWPDEFQEGHDLRDFYKAGGTWELLQEMVTDQASWTSTPEEIQRDTRPRYEGDRPEFDEVLQVYRKWLHMTPEHETVLRLIYALILSSRIDGDPLWIFIVGAPGAGKTELLMSTSGCVDVVTASSISPTSLISGWNGGGGDPSLIPRLIGSVFLLKDFTEILDMPKTDRDHVYAILRGAYDGEVTRDYGNGVRRVYKGTFSMAAGVTYAIDRENNSSMGERFLKYRMSNQSEEVRRKVMLDSLRNSGRETQMRNEIQDTAKRFLDPLVDVSDLDVPLDILERIICLAELASPMRTQVERDAYQHDRLKYRPVSEVGTRISKQLKKLLMGMAMIHSPAQITEDDFQLLAKVALDSCMPYYLDIVRALIKDPGLSVQDLGDKLALPTTTLREVLDDMTMIGIVERIQEESRSLVGRRPYLYYLTDHVIRKWKQAGVV